MDPSDVLQEPNAEVRRCMIEIIGWDAFVETAKLTQIGSTVPDPGNPGEYLTLYDVPEQIFDTPIRVLLCTNATPEKDGSRHRFGLTIPASISDPIAAAAWTFNVTPSQYAQLEAAC
jgi:hypothetical protein